MVKSVFSLGLGRMGWTILVLLLVGCSGSKQKLEKELTSIRTKITSIRADQDRMEERLEAMELRAVQSQPKRATRRNERPRLKVIHLGPDEGGEPAAEEDAASVPLDAEPEPDDPRPVIRGQGDRVIKTGDPGGSAKRTNSAVDVYEAALTEVREGRFEKGIAAFEAFLESHPKGPYADNAVYWIGEAHYARGELDQAIRRFSQVVRDYPRGNKVPDALLKLGIAQKRVGKERNAQNSFAKLTQHYPATDAARRVPRGDQR